MIRTLRSCAIALLLLGCSLRLSAQHAVDSGRGFEMAPPTSYDDLHFLNEPINHLGVQIQGGLTRLTDYPYALGPAFPTVVDDHLVPFSLTATATWYGEPFDLPIGIGLGYQYMSLRSTVDYPGIPARWVDGDTVVMTGEAEAENSAESIVLDLTIDVVNVALGPGDLYIRTGLRNRLSLHRERTESVTIDGEGGARWIVVDDTVPLIDNGARAMVVWSEEGGVGFDMAVNVGLGWRMGFPGGWTKRSLMLGEDEVIFEDLNHGPILIIPTIDFYLPVIGSHPIEQASWEVQMGVGFVVPL
jgi:hypothetical protein